MGYLRWAFKRKLQACQMQFKIVRHPMSKPKYRGLNTIAHVADVVKYIADFLDLHSLRRLSDTCRSLRLILHTEPTLQLKRSLHPYFPNALPDLKATLQASGTILSGSAPVSIIQPGDWIPGDLDFVVPARTLNFVTTFLHTQGYIPYCPEPTSPPTMSNNPTEYHEHRGIWFKLLEFSQGEHSASTSPSSTPADATSL